MANDGAGLGLRVPALVLVLAMVLVLESGTFLESHRIVVSAFWVADPMLDTPYIASTTNSPHTKRIKQHDARNAGNKSKTRAYLLSAWH
jgi:hypothetical protein